jgi:hypothetical protein
MHPLLHSASFQDTPSSITSNFPSGDLMTQAGIEEQGMLMMNLGFPIRKAYYFV